MTDDSSSRPTQPGLPLRPTTSPPQTTRTAQTTRIVQTTPIAPATPTQPTAPTRPTRPSRVEHPDIFTAVGDPRRRRIVELLAEADRSVGALTAELAIAQPSVTQHLAVLREVGIVSSRKEGTSSIYSLKPGALDALTQWVAFIGSSESQ